MQKQMGFATFQPRRTAPGASSLDKGFSGTSCSNLLGASREKPWEQHPLSRRATKPLAATLIVENQMSPHVQRFQLRVIRVRDYGKGKCS